MMVGFFISTRVLEKSAPKAYQDGQSYTKLASSSKLGYEYEDIKR